MPAARTLSLRINSYLRTDGIPLDAYLSSPNQETIQAIDDVNNHRNMSRKFSSVEELMEDLNA